MTARADPPLLAAGGMSALAALLHVAIIAGGAPWYRFFGAGERMAAAAAAGRAYPAMVTSVIAAVLALWAAYALSGAGVLARLPLRKLALVVIAGVYLLRGLVIVPALAFARGPSTPLLLWSSLFCLACGALHVLGLTRVWSRL